MKNALKFFGFLLVIGGFVFASCQKDNVIPEEPVKANPALMAGIRKGVLPPDSSFLACYRFDYPIGVVLTTGQAQAQNDKDIEGYLGAQMLADFIYPFNMTDVRTSTEITVESLGQFLQAVDDCN
jgi:hypothetical protein